MPKVRVAFFAEILSEDKDGASRTMFQLIKRIPRDRFDFLFLCGKGPDQLMDWPCIHMPTLTIPYNSTYAMAIPALAKKRVIAALDLFQPDIIHIATPSLLGHFALKYAKKQHIPIITIYHTHFISYIDYYFSRFPLLIAPLKRYIQKQKKLFYNQCDSIYVPSRSILKELETFDIHPSRMQLWERGIDNQLFNPEKRNIAKMYAITGNNFPTILFASRLVWEKNLATLFHIHHELQARGVACNFLIAGDGQARKACEQAMKGAIFLGQIDHELLAMIYASADVFVFPSVSEAFGNVVLEAMASGLPCVIANAGGSKDFIQNGVNGFSCDPYNAQAFADCIEKLLTEDTLHEQFQHLSLQKSRKLNWEKLAAVYFDDIIQLSKLPNMYKLIP